MGSQGEFSRSFKGIWIPSALYLATNLNISQKILLVEIDSLDNGERGCFASNSYFSKFLQVSESQASRLINSLVKAQLINSKIHTEKGRNNERRIHLVQPISHAFLDDRDENADALRNFRGVWIPSSLYLAQDLSPTQKVLLVEIDSLDRGERGCFAGNAYFSKFLQVSESQASRLINSLVKIGLISSQSYSEKGRNNERRLHLVQPISIAFPELMHGVSDASGGVRKNAEKVSAKVRKGSTQKCVEGIRKNAEHNKPVNKTINKPVITNGEKAEKFNATSVYDQWFNEFWDLYPNKKSGRKKPRELLEKILRSGVQFDTIKKSIETHKLTRSWVQGYVPYATTWLNQHRWESEFSDSDFIIPVNSPNQRAAAQERLADNSGLDALLEQHHYDNARPVGREPLTLEHKVY